ncbi:cutinase family protein [Nocardia sp. IFM 10818]
MNAPAAVADAPGCEPVAVFGIGGHDDPDANVYGLGIRKVRYSASIWPLRPVTYDDSVREGRDNMVRAVEKYAAACGGHIVVKGYSQGARAAGDAIEVLQNGPYRDRLAGVLYADPKRPGGIEHAFRGLSLAGMTFTGPRAGFTVPVRSECNPRDAVCDFPLWTDPRRAVDNVRGYLTGAHAYDVNN